MHSRPEHKEYKENNIRHIIEDNIPPLPGQMYDQNQIQLKDYAWKPQVKNWFTKSAYQNGPSKLCNLHGYDDWVDYNLKAVLGLTVEPAFFSIDNNYAINLRVVGTFTPAGDHSENTPQFVDFYQDIAKISVENSEKHITKIDLKKANLAKSSNENNTVKNSVRDPSVEFSSELSASSKVLETGLHPSLGLHATSQRREREFHSHDFSCSSTRVFSNKSSVNHTATQVHCYSNGNPSSYKISYPDFHMHWYGYIPDFFSEPSSLAKGNLTIDSNQIYYLDEKSLKSKELELSFDIKLSQRIVGMSMWRLCANHSFINTANLTYNLKLTLDPKIKRFTHSSCSPTFFKSVAEHRRNHVRGIGGMTGVTLGENSQTDNTLGKKKY